MINMYNEILFNLKSKEILIHVITWVKPEHINILS